MKHKPLKQKEIAAFCTQLELLINAGITPYESISLMIEDSTSKVERDFLVLIENELKNGSTLSESLVATNLFPVFLTNMLALAEETGTLDTVLKNLAIYYERIDNIYESIRGSLLYPVIMLAVMFVMVFILMSSILPTINQVYVSLGTTLTGFTGFLFNLSRILQSASAIIYCIFFIDTLVLVGIYHYSNKHQKYILTRNLSYNLACAQFGACLSLITSSGIDIYRGLVIAKTIISNETLLSKIDASMQYIKEGDYIYEALKKGQIFHPIQLRMLEIGFKTGNPDYVLDKISNQYGEDLLNKLHRVLSAVEPTLVIIFSIIVGLILISALLPLIGIMSNIG